MITLTQYLHAEEPDPTEPASFYVPGATDWVTHPSTIRRGAARRILEDLQLNYEEDDFEEV